MDKKSVEELEAQLKELVEKTPLAGEELAALIREAPQGKAKAWVVTALNAFEREGSFDATFKFVEATQKVIADALDKSASPTVCTLLRKMTKDRLLLSYIDGVGFDKRVLREAFGRLGRLLSFQKGALVLNAAWGLGTVRESDYFYRRITVDFAAHRGHQFTYEAACETLTLAPENHILVTQKADPERVAKMLTDEPDKFIKEMLLSFGDMPVTRLEELSAQYGFVKTANWKKFWEAARLELRKDKCVEIPTRRAEPIHLKKQAEDFSSNWFSAFATIKDPKSILSSVRELQAESGDRSLTPEERTKIAERLAFALKATRKTDDALFARIAICISDLGLDAELANNEKLAFACSAKSRAYLWEKLLSDETRYLAAARTLPARETGALVTFLTSGSTEEEKAAAKEKLFAEIPQMCFSLLSAVVDEFKKDPACEETCAELLKTPSAPATLVTLILGRYEKDFKAWAKLPPFVVILMHAIALGEGRQGGETLRMQNIIRRLFADQKWLEETMGLLQPADKALFFERFQASIAWDPSTHHMIVMRMTKIDTSLASRLYKKASPKKIERITSLRSYAERQAAYEHLVKVEIPANTKRIEFAKSYGDLSENAEYQYAKDEQRTLMQKESLLQKDLNEVKAVDFSDVTEPTTVVPGSCVTIVTAAGEEKVFTVLGEWDNDLDRGIIANKTKLAENMLGKTAGETFELPDTEGNVSIATIKAVSGLTDELRAWVSTTPVEA